MGFILELKSISSKQQSSSKKTKERFIFPKSIRNPKDPDKLKSNNGVGPPCSDPSHKAQQVADGKIQNQETVKGSTTRSDELVKHMSNLPSYLRRTDRGDNVQGKALNVGVLDWTRLEKWKHKQTRIPALASNFTSFTISESSSRTTIKSSVSAARNEKLANQQGLLSSNMKASYKEGLPQSAKLSFPNVKHQRSETETESIRDEQRFTHWPFKSSGKSRLDISIEKEKRKDSDKITSQVGKSASNLRRHGISRVPDENINGEAEKNMEGMQKEKDRNHKSTSGMGLASSKLRDKGVSFHSKKQMCSSNCETKEVEQFWESDIDVGQKLHHSKPSNIVLLRPQEIPQSNSRQAFHLSQLRMSFDGNFTESSQSSFSNVSLLDELYSEYGYSEIPHSCPLHLAVEPAPTSEAMQDRTNTDEDTDHSSVVSKIPNCSNKTYSLQSEGKYNEKDALDIKLRNECVFSNSNESLDQETAELTTQRGRNPSHNRRFSFSLGRIGRSISFKEGSRLPQFSSTYVSVKSGPVTSESSTRLDTSSKDKAYSHSRTRSSPLRRLLDPILKHKASEIHHSAESSRIQKGSLDSISFRTINGNKSLHAEKSEGLSIQALLQLTIKNGLPLFKFVLNNERKILVATVKNLASPEKDESGCHFTFYLVNEVKKKSGGWISHGSKEKSCGYVYNVVGQMKSLSSKIAEPRNQNSKRQHLVKEYVLLGVETSQTDQVPPKFIKSQELAAVVVEIPCENFSQGVDGDNNLLKKGCLKCIAEDKCSCRTGENDISGSTTVILPGGIHGSPNKGEPSPLIHRWKTGGSCDCGGWDIGCKLLILSNQKERSNILRSSKSHRGRFQLFVQEGSEQNGPLFTLVPLKDGFYSVEFNSSISLLQAFFISVAALSCQKPGTLETSKMHEEIVNELSSKNNDRFQGKAPLKYTPIPPLSPVGRV